MKTLNDFDFKNKRVLVRCEFNVPLDEKGNISDDFRIVQTLPTINYLIEKGAKLLLMCHLGRPDGKIVKKLRLDPVAEKLSVLLGRPIKKLNDCVGAEVEEAIQKIQSGEVFLLENLRFYKEEEENDENFAKKLSKLGDIYINDAFGDSHRAHASIVGVPKYLPHGAGFLLEKEVKFLTKIMKNPKRPLVAIIGGKKIEKTKLNLINRFSGNGGWVLIGGLIKKGIKEKNIKLDEPQKVIEPVEEVIGLDISQKTVNLFKEKIKKAKTIFWDGVLGKTEEKKFQAGSEAIARAIIASSAFSVVGGGETVEFINRLGLSGKFNHVSTGGGAMLDFISDGKLVGIEALKNGGN